MSGTRRRQSLTDGPSPQTGRPLWCTTSLWPPSSIDSSFSHTQLTSCRLHRYVSTSFTLPPVPCSSFELRACSRACSHAASISLVFPLRPRASLFPSPGRLDGWMCGYLTHQCHHLSSVVCRLSSVCRASFRRRFVPHFRQPPSSSSPVPMAISESKKKRLEAKAAKAAAKGETVSRVSSKASLKKVDSVADSLASQMEDGTSAFSSLLSLLCLLLRPLPTLTRTPCTYV